MSNFNDRFMKITFSGRTRILNPQPCHTIFFGKIIYVYCKSIENATSTIPRDAYGIPGGYIYIYTY